MPMFAQAACARACALLVRVSLLTAGASRVAASACSQQRNTAAELAAPSVEQHAVAIEASPAPSSKHQSRRQPRSGALNRPRPHPRASPQPARRAPRAWLCRRRSRRRAARPSRLRCSMVRTGTRRRARPPSRRGRSARKWVSALAAPRAAAARAAADSSHAARRPSARTRMSTSCGDCGERTHAKHASPTPCPAAAPPAQSTGALQTAPPTTAASARTWCAARRKGCIPTSRR